MKKTVASKISFCLLTLILLASSGLFANEIKSKTKLQTYSEGEIKNAQVNLISSNCIIRDRSPWKVEGTKFVCNSTDDCYIAPSVSYKVIINNLSRSSVKELSESSNYYSIRLSNGETLTENHKMDCEKMASDYYYSIIAKNYLDVFEQVNAGDVEYDSETRKCSKQKLFVVYNENSLEFSNYYTKPILAACP